jgi:hypothetical protein
MLSPGRITRLLLRSTQLLAGGLLLSRPNSSGVNEVLFTVGYEQHRTPASLVAALRAARVEHLVDVRELPLSRRRGFSKRALSAALADAGVALHLGIPRPDADAPRASGQLRAAYDAAMRDDTGKPPASPQP